MKRLLLFLTVLALASWVSAQEMSAQEVVNELESAIADLDDARFEVIGSYIDEDDTQYFAAEVEVIFDENLARVTFSAPEDLSGNVVLIDGDTARNYLAEGDTVVVMDMGESRSATSTSTSMAAMPDASLFGISLNGANPLSLDLSNLFQGWTPTLLESEEGRYELRFRNPDAFGLDHIDAVVVQQGDGWAPEALRFVRNGSSLLDIRMSGLETNVGLTASELSELP